MYRYKGKKILITGATGLIGSHMISRLMKEQAIIFAMGRKLEKLERIFDNYLCNENFECLEGNIVDGIPNNVGKVDYIFHAASPISGMTIRSNPMDVILTNLNGTIQCFEYLKKQQQNTGYEGRVIIFSSATIYGNCQQKDVSVKEEETQIAEVLESVTCSYSESKRMVEVIARAYLQQYKIKSVIARIGYVYGYTQQKPNTAFYEFIDRALQGQDIVMNNSGTPKRDNIYVEDVIDGLLLIGEKGVDGEAYNISSNGEKDNFAAIDEIAEVIKETVNRMRDEKRIHLIFREQSKIKNSGIKLDNHKIKKMGWKLTTSLETGIEQTIEQFNKEYRSEVQR